MTRNQVEKVPVQPKTGGLLRLILIAEKLPARFIDPKDAFTGAAKKAYIISRDFWPAAFRLPSQ
jgi:hypothetical protein